MSEPESTQMQFQKLSDPFTLSSGQQLRDGQLGYETYGELNAQKDNAILVFHALSGTPHLTGENQEGPGNQYWNEECHGGWWDAFVGSGKAIDTDRYFVICCNYIGGCYGSTGPASIDPETGNPYGGAFPHVRAVDIVDTQVELLDALGIDRLHAVIGPSIGGLLCLTLATRHPSRVNIVISIGSALEISPLQRIVIFEQVLAIENDPHFNGGNYYDGEAPKSGLSLARMISHKTFISLKTLERRARREVAKFDNQLSWYKMDSPLESYMLHQGLKFVDRFDANTYLRILEVWQKYDAFADAGVTESRELFARSKKQQWLIFSIDSDVCFYPDQQTQLAKGLREADVPGS
ncbi:MAG: homoserine O-acetyltransferase [Verrucomicrobiota bacterium]